MLPWEPTDDVFQVGSLALSLLEGRPVEAEHVEQLAAHIRDLTLPDPWKYWLWHSLGPREWRFRNAGEALEQFLADPPNFSATPRRLKDQRIVLTGAFRSGTQAELARKITKAGGTVQEAVGPSTDILVRGRYDVSKPMGTAGGRKLFDAWLLRSRGSRIALISEAGLTRRLT